MSELDVPRFHLASDEDGILCLIVDEPSSVAEGARLRFRHADGTADTEEFEWRTVFGDDAHTTNFLGYGAARKTWCAAVGHGSTDFEFLSVPGR